MESGQNGWGGQHTSYIMTSFQPPRADEKGLPNDGTGEGRGEWGPTRGKWHGCRSPKNAVAGSRSTAHYSSLAAGRSAPHTAYIGLHRTKTLRKEEKNNNNNKRRKKKDPYV